MAATAATKGQTTDGGDLGADVDAVLSTIDGVQ
jgi:hypothetical protein